MKKNTYNNKKKKRQIKIKNWAYELGKWQRLSSLLNNVIDINAIYQTCIVSQYIFRLFSFFIICTIFYKFI